MRLIDMHCDTIMALMGNEKSLRSSDNMIDVEKLEKGDYEIYFEIPINVPNYMKEASYLLTRDNKKVAYVMKNKNITAIVGYIKNV